MTVKKKEDPHCFSSLSRLGLQRQQFSAGKPLCLSPSHYTPGPQGGSRGIPRPPESYDLCSVSLVSSQMNLPPNSSPGRQPGRMPAPPRLVPLSEEQQQLYFECLSSLMILTSSAFQLLVSTVLFFLWAWVKDGTCSILPPEQVPEILYKHVYSTLMQS